MDVRLKSDPLLRALRFGFGLMASVFAIFLMTSATGMLDPQRGVIVYAQEPARAPGTPFSTNPHDPYPMPPHLVGVNLMEQTDAEVHAKSAGCITCHANVGDPHDKKTVKLGCVDCHGGDPKATEIGRAHVHPRNPQLWRSSGNPERSYTLLNHESPEFVRFVNPGDFRIAHISCGTANCHPNEVYTNRKQIMTHGCMLWGAALYNNGSVPFKKPRYGEFYAMDGTPLRAITNPPPNQWEMDKKGVLPYLDPLPRFEVSQPGNVLRIFERFGRFFPAEVGIPEIEEEPGRPRTRLTVRGLGTKNRTDPVLIGLNKTRLLDPTLNFLGTNDHPGDYRSSGCTACHVIYANDRSPVHSGPYAKFGNRGTSFNPDPTIPKNESGHPIAHRFTNSIPTSQCMVCHTHPGTTVMNSYIGYMWWDEETEGHLMYPKEQKELTAEELVRSFMLNPDEAAARGLWSNPEFLHDIVQLNPHMSKQQFADFHGHGWVYRAVYKQDRKGQLLDHRGEPVQHVTPEKLAAALAYPVEAKTLYKKKFESTTEIVKAEQNLDCRRDGLPVHNLDVHMERGMHCVDCHFVQDMHGNGRLHQEVRAACEIQCIDCHGTITKEPTLRTSGPAAYTSTTDPEKPGRDMLRLRTPFGKPRFEWRGKRLIQHSMVEPDLEWEVTQTKDTIDESHPRYNAKAALAKTVRFEDDQMVWGKVPEGGEDHCAHANDNMSCIACHSSWNPSCYGCHLPQRANLKMPELHWNGDVSRNYVSYNFQTLRDEVYMLCRDGDVTGNRIGPGRSSCAIHVGSYNNNRESIYFQQQTISAEGLSGIAFSSNVPHTVSAKGTTKRCTDCHVSESNDNNAWMAQLLMHGTNYLNLMGRYTWVAAEDHGLFAVEVTERDEPQAVIGSSLHKDAFPKNFKKHLEHGGELVTAYEHPGVDIADRLKRPLQTPEILQVQPRGEYLYTACGKDGFRAFDIAFTDNKGFSERMTSGPFSPIGHNFHVPSKYCTGFVVPTTLAPDPTRQHFVENKEPTIPLYYAFVYVLDKFEGVILVNIATTIDGDPLNNFLKRDLTFNPNGLLDGAKGGTMVGSHLYVCCNKGLVVIDFAEPTKPQVKSVIGGPFLNHPHAVAAQFRYMYVVDKEGVKVLDITEHGSPRPVSLMRIPDLHNIYLARTYAYLAAGPRGLIILDITQADKPRIDQIYTADGQINDLHDVKLGITYTSEFAYLADGKNGLRVVQLTSPETSGNGGFAPRPTPKLIATHKIPLGGHAISVNKGLDRDRAVDEAGHQIAVFGRIGARPLNAEEQRKMYLRNGRLWQVSDDPLSALYRKIK